MGSSAEKEEEGRRDVRWCRNNHPREWEGELSREIDQGRQEAWDHIGGLWS